MIIERIVRTDRILVLIKTPESRKSAARFFAISGMTARALGQPTIIPTLDKEYVCVETSHLVASYRLADDRSNSFAAVISIGSDAKRPFRASAIASAGTSGNCCCRNSIEAVYCRATVGFHHRFSVKCLDWYMAMVAWKEDTRDMGVR
ncbi:hypothetical protein [Rhizobium laguerreae]|uniref:hypothetical protein n=1 Tax=Rhizobium laguerreae TaxID=1076926 RepID=UPI0021B0C0C2|nr:hypothetical protein [Rhizobium laguerreae]